ncbi:MAG: (d)CMP kinase [Oscillospiraceae bacterium]|nr:(d)CMP kinase [Oscillospiraceae bacterium]
MNYISVAVDGPAGAGKSSVSKTVAKDLGYTYIDTGAMYRCVALFAIENGIDIKNDVPTLIAGLDGIKIDMRNTGDGQRVYLNGLDVSERIREEDVSVGASDVAVIPEVRVKLVDMQREMAKSANVIMDGRDICSHVLPDAQVKIFLTASIEARAKRRYDELCRKGIECDFEKIKSDIAYRDKNDSEREVSPLKKAEDAVLLDTTELCFDEVVEKIKELIINVV